MTVRLSEPWNPHYHNSLFFLIRRTRQVTPGTPNNWSLESNILDCRRDTHCHSNSNSWTQTRLNFLVKWHVKSGHDAIPPFIPLCIIIMHVMVTLFFFFHQSIRLHTIYCISMPDHLYTSLPFHIMHLLILSLNWWPLCSHFAQNSML